MAGNLNSEKFFFYSFDFFPHSSQLTFLRRLSNTGTDNGIGTVPKRYVDPGARSALWRENLKPQFCARPILRGRRPFSKKQRLYESIFSETFLLFTAIPFEIGYNFLELIIFSKTIPASAIRFNAVEKERKK